MVAGIRLVSGPLTLLDEAMTLKSDRSTAVAAR
jgi:hypothetical protein